MTVPLCVGAPDGDADPEPVFEGVRLAVPDWEAEKLTVGDGVIVREGVLERVEDGVWQDVGVAVDESVTGVRVSEADCVEERERDGESDGVVVALGEDDVDIVPLALGLKSCDPEAACVPDRVCVCVCDCDAEPVREGVTLRV